MPDSKRLLIAGFKPFEVNLFIENGADVRAAFYNEDRTMNVQLPPIELYTHYDVVRYNVAVPLRLDFPWSLRQSLYDASFTMFRRHHARVTFLRNRSFRSWIDFDNLFHISANFFYDILKRRDINCVVFSNFPHQGNYIILYYLAKLMGIETVISTQSQFAGKMWLVKSLEDFGAFSEVDGAHESLAAPAAPTQPFYMKRRRGWKRLLGTVVTVAREGLKLAAKFVSFKAVFDPQSVDRNMSRFAQARDKLRIGSPSPNDVSDVDLGVPYVYFPLHLQPEMTTDTWGLAYADQLLAIEELAAALPSDVLIYAKENPIQTRFMREESFYRRLRAIPNMRYVGEHVPSFELIKNSLFVATISGTAGYEAVLMGKSAIYFGVAWYGSLPGVFRWEGRSTVGQALEFKHDRATLEAGFSRLTGKLYPGVVDLHYGVLVPGFDRVVEGAKAVDSILAVLREAPVSPARRD